MVLALTFLESEMCFQLIIIMVILIYGYAWLKGNHNYNINIARRRSVKWKARDMVQSLFNRRLQHAKVVKPKGFRTARYIVFVGDSESVPKRKLKIKGYLEDTKCFEFFIDMGFLKSPAWFLCHPSLVANTHQRCIPIRARGFQPISIWSMPLLRKGDSDYDDNQWKNYYHSFINSLLVREEITLIMEQSLNNDIDALTVAPPLKEIVIREPIGNRIEDENNEQQEGGVQ